jgi:hypothetical protein
LLIGDLHIDWLDRRVWRNRRATVLAIVDTRRHPLRVWQGPYQKHPTEHKSCEKCG